MHEVLQALIDRYGSAWEPATPCPACECQGRIDHHDGPLKGAVDPCPVCDQQRYVQPRPAGAGEGTVKVKYLLRVYNDTDTYYGTWEKRRVLDAGDDATVLAAFRAMMDVDDIPLEMSYGFIQAVDFSAHRVSEKYELVTCLEIGGKLFRLTEQEV